MAAAAPSGYGFVIPLGTPGKGFKFSASAPLASLDQTVLADIRSLESLHAHIPEVWAGNLRMPEIF